MKQDSLIYLGLMRKTMLLGKNQEFDSAIAYTHRLLKLAIKNKDTLYMSKANTKLGLYNESKNELELSFKYYNQSFRASRSLGDSLRAGISLLRMANIQSTLGDYSGSKTTAIDGIKYSENSKDVELLSGLYHIISVSELEQKKYSKALKYNELAISLEKDMSSQNFNNSNLHIFKNTRANILSSKGDYYKSILILSALVGDSVVKNNKLEYSRILDNLGYIKWLKNQKDSTTIDFLNRALMIRKQMGDIEGLIASNIHLTKYYLNKNNSKAFKYAESAYQNALELGSLTSIIESLGYIFQLKDNVTEEAKVYHETSQKLNKINQSNREIYAVTKYENELLEQQNIQLAQKNDTMTGYIHVAAVLLVFSMIGVGYYAYQRHQYKKRFNAVLARQQEPTTAAIATKPNPNPGIKELPASMSQETLDHLRNALQQFEAQEHYLAPDINVHTLAQKFNSNTSYVSMMINADKQKTMNQYINDLRIDYAITRLQQDKVFRKYTVKAIAQDIGFNSAENFAKKFYKKTGIYPSYYIKKLNEDA
ncbi:helix-turn-helix transcriptional regulator [Aquimarina sp. U1-2]|uniref:helix-turn-helix domain-containing protein n=1 Tax=Aquimarina sp. U1-2 TaxID=2823141 RepID=UPI001AEC9388|nr:AraC family transcriptional regulator [Aquimarina sp. U1-2]MBP2832140.1 helix-turn-helix transcriptional regulator [Aquimarina sp. U1-2]